MQRGSHMEIVLYTFLFPFVHSAYSQNIRHHYSNKYYSTTFSKFNFIQINKNLKIEENSNLDYKAAVSLNKSLDLKKRKIAKDVSAMANSDGDKPMI